MHNRAMESRTALISLFGAAVWAGIAVLAGLRRAPAGVIELLLLFAALVVVPLGLGLVRSESRAGVNSRFVVLQPIAALAVVASFWQRPGLVASALSVPWFVLGVVVAARGMWNLHRNKKRSLADLAVSVAGMDLAFAGGWLVVSRAGLHPMGFQEPIILLTSMHFHYSGFAVAVLAAAAVRACERRNVSIGILRAIVWLVLFLPFLLAAGFVISPLLRAAAAVGLAVSVPAFAVCLIWIARFLDVPVARVYLRTGALAACVAMVLVGAYAVTDYLGRPFLTMPGMASTHGVLNGIGFVLCSMLAFLMEENATEPAASSEAATKRAPTDSIVPRKRPASVPSYLPEFVAREFYDR
jgi:YndJ-like protein